MLDYDLAVKLLRLFLILAPSPVALRGALEQLNGESQYRDLARCLAASICFAVTSAPLPDGAPCLVVARNGGRAPTETKSALRHKALKFLSLCMSVWQIATPITMNHLASLLVAFAEQVAVPEEPPAVVALIAELGGLITGSSMARLQLHATRIVPTWTRFAVALARRVLGTEDQQRSASFRSVRTALSLIGPLVNPFVEDLEVLEPLVAALAPLLVPLLGRILIPADRDLRSSEAAYRAKSMPLALALLETMSQTISFPRRLGAPTFHAFARSLLAPPFDRAREPVVRRTVGAWFRACIVDEVVPTLVTVLAAVADASDDLSAPSPWLRPVLAWFDTQVTLARKSAWLARLVMTLAWTPPDPATVPAHHRVPVRRPAWPLLVNPDEAGVSAGCALLALLAFPPLLPVAGEDPSPAAVHDGDRRCRDPAAHTAALGGQRWVTVTGADAVRVTGCRACWSSVSPWFAALLGGGFAESRAADVTLNHVLGRVLEDVYALAALERPVSAWWPAAREATMAEVRGRVERLVEVAVFAEEQLASGLLDKVRFALAELMDMRPVATAAASGDGDSSSGAAVPSSNQTAHARAEFATTVALTLLRESLDGADGNEDVHVVSALGSDLRARAMRVLLLRMPRIDDAAVRTLLLDKVRERIAALNDETE
ncbi:hypothetical protein H9P43_002282 [Blastocladiella emersonii ATCC 22665]|nr:hypothetical protein H9P43_002282 [Blastocladiella emersonii ATCC 22665]